MNRLPLSIALAGAIASAALGAPQASAQNLPFVPDIYMGLEVGAAERNASAFGQPGTVIDTDASGGVDYGAFVGVELPIFPLGYAAVEANIGDSTGETSALVRDGTTDSEVSSQANFNWSGTARLGLTPLPGLAAYGIAGYGGENVDITVTDLASGAQLQTDDSMDGIIYGLGAKYDIGTDFGIRAEFRHREASGSYDPEQVMVGAFVRF